MLTARERPLLFVYLGRRGIGDLVYNLAQSARASGDPWKVVLSSEADELDRFDQFDNAVLKVPTFRRSYGALSPALFLRARWALAEHIKAHPPSAVVTLMPHVWSAALSPLFRSQGLRYTTIIHDARPHPGDRAGLVTRLLLEDARHADRVIVLSRSVEDEVINTGLVERQRLRTLFHPLTGHDQPSKKKRSRPVSGQPWRMLFIGRLLRYKGLPLFIDAFEKLRANGHFVEASVMGEGDIGSHLDRLNKLGIQVVNRWLSSNAITEAMAHHHFVVLSHIEASQSGIAASAVGAGLPVVATPVGGLSEQIVHGETGLLSVSVDANGVADAIERLISDEGLYEKLANGAPGSADLSMDHFLERLRAVALGLE